MHTYTCVCLEQRKESEGVRGLGSEEERKESKGVRRLGSEDKDIRKSVG